MGNPVIPLPVETRAEIESELTRRPDSTYWQDRLKDHHDDCRCDDCLSRIAKEEEEERREEEKRVEKKRQYQEKKAGLFIKLTLKRGLVVVTPEEKEEIGRILWSVWNHIGHDVAGLYVGKRIPKSHIIEMVLDANRPETIGLGELLRRGKRREESNNVLAPTVEYILRYPYEKETRTVIHKIANETFKNAG